MPGQPPWVLSLCIPTTLFADNSFYFYLFIYFDTDDHASVQCSCLGLLFVPISYRIGTHQSKRVDRVCGGHLSRSGRPPGLAREAFCRERMEGCRRGACVLRDPPSPETLRAPRVGGTEFQPPAGLPQLTSPRNSHSEGAGVRFQGRFGLPELRDPPAATAHRQPYRATVMGTAPCVCNLWLPVGATPGGPQPLPVRTVSGRAGSTTRESA